MRPGSAAGVQAPQGTDTNRKTEIAVLAGGCFWGVEEILRGVPGVLDTDVGYTGGWVENPTYEDTHGSRSGHAEAIRVTFDPSVLSYEDLLEQWFFKLHDPTTKNRQGNDVGTQYRSAIYFTTPDQEATAREITTAYEPILARAGYGPITTEIKLAPDYYYAEDYHQQYLAKNPSGYCGVGGTGVSCPVELMA
jgi:methionine-S-sulfoxide reductase